MENRRYPEDGAIPVLTYPKASISGTDSIRIKRRTKYIIPKDAITSSTSKARDCFVKREFSKKLQQAMLNYSYTLVTTKVLSGEV